MSQSPEEIDAEIGSWETRIWELAQEAETQGQQGSLMVAVISFVAKNISMLPQNQQNKVLLAIDQAVVLNGEIADERVLS